MPATRNLAHRAFIAAAAVLLSRAAAAADAPACWNRDIERIDYFTNPPERGDNNFFTTVVAQTGNVSLLYPAKATMREFEQKIYRIRVDLGGATPTGCSNEYLNALTYFMPRSVPAPSGSATYQGVYNPALTYPDPETTYSGGGGVNDGFTSTSFYRYTNWPNGSGGTAETAAAACGALKTAAGVAIPNADVVNCQKCLGAITGGTNRGYYLNPYANNNDNTANAGVFAGNWLNFHPPKWAMLRLAYKRLVNGPLLSVLREAVVAQNGTTGGQVVQKMLPQSCQGSGRPLNQKQGAVDSLTYTSAANPLSEMLFNTAWYMGGQETTWFFGGDTHAMGGGNIGKSGPCNGCNADFIVLFADGRGDSANPQCATVLGITPAQCTTAAVCGTAGMGAEDDGNDYLNPATHSDVSSVITGSTVRQQWPGTCDMDFADDVAGWMNTHDVSYGTAGTKVKTYVVAIGDAYNTYGEMSALQGVAAMGDGMYVVADNFADLEANIEAVFNDIIHRSTSFSVAAITTVQTRGSTFAFIPRFRPLEGPQWEGHLLRFKLFNEFSAGCDPNKDYGTKSYQNPNGNSSCTDLYLKDKNDNFVAEDVDAGYFVVLDNNAALQADGGWPAKTGADGGPVIATEIWDTEKLLENRIQQYIATFNDDRRIYTVSPSGGAYGPALIDFSIANVSQITPLLQLNGKAGDFCTSLAGLTRHTYATDDDCTVDVIKFIRGYDVLKQNPLNRIADAGVVSTVATRPNIMGDIFHSSPQLVTPPVLESFCDLGLFNQCLESLWMGPTPSASYSGYNDAYGKYVADNKSRQEIILVGANDGMLHAFQAGTWTLGDDPDTPNITEAADAGHFDYGTGQELWAFIPPDLLPKLQRYVINTRHEVFVDGTPWIRDIWVDGSGATSKDYTKQSDEFHTVAVVGEREGGRHYFALDVTNPNSPTYLWTWPKPGTAEELNVGESWNDVAPAPPPIGNIAWADPSSPININGTKAAERWVVALSGGYDPDYLRGRGVYVLDVWTGQLLWKFTKADSTGATDLRDALFPVAATPSFVLTQTPGTWDTLVVADIAGQVWTFSMVNPGKDNDGDGLADNWPGARAFIQQKTSAIYKRAPFFYRASLAPVRIGTTNMWRVLLGSGNRDQIKDGQGGTCGLADIDACLRQNCSVDINANQRSVGSHSVLGHWAYTAGASTFGTNTVTMNSGDTQNSACTDKATIDVEYSITCGATTVPYSNLLTCDWGNGVTSGIECPTDDGKPLGTKLTWTPSVTQEYTKFYSFNLFDTAGTKRVPFTTTAGATTYDTNALTETDLVDASTCPVSPSLGSCAVATSNGWVLKHTNSVTGQPMTPGDEKTGSSALLLPNDDCVIWNTLLPNNAQVLSCNGTIPPDNAYVYQANAATGHIQCGLVGSQTANATVRSVRRDTNVTPQQFTPVVGVNSVTGQISLSGVSIEPGAPPLQIQAGTTELVGPVHWLEVSRTTHNCRHGPSDGGTPTCVTSN